MTKPITVLQLYPRDMNIYGDWGNVLTVLRRAQWHGYEPKLIEYNPDDAFPKEADIIIGGGGQDAGQDKIQADLLKIGPRLRELAVAGTPMLVVCGLYQMFGQSFTTRDGHVIKGIGLFDMKTLGGAERLIGNIVIKSQRFGELVGYENHSGQTFLTAGVKPLGLVQKGAGNNLRDGHEGAVYKNVIGTYLHGSVLPKNPLLADWLIEKAAVKKFGDFTPTVIDDRFAVQARNIAMKRPR
jgi:CobQ-like glutamine amidotransferase family enzyme